MMSRRGLLAALLTAPAVLAETPRADALVMGDSWAWQQGPRIAKLAHARQLRTALDARGGESARDFVQYDWWKRACGNHRPRQIIAALGLNCVQRKRLAEDYATLIEQSPCPVLWLLPHQGDTKRPETLFPMDLSYMRDALAEVEADVFRVPALPLELGKKPGTRDVHLTSRSNDKLAQLLAAHLWSDG